MSISLILIAGWVLIIYFPYKTTENKNSYWKSTFWFSVGFHMHWLIRLYDRPTYSCRNWALEVQGQDLDLKLGFSFNFRFLMFHFLFCAWFLRPHLTLTFYIPWLGISYSPWRVANSSLSQIVNSNHLWRNNGLDRCHLCFFLNRYNDGSFCWLWLLSMTSAQTGFCPQKAEALQTSVPSQWQVSGPCPCTFCSVWDITTLSCLVVTSAL